METINLPLFKKSEKLYQRAYLLAIITILYNIVEGIVSVSFGLEDETLALLGFGLDSFVEVISGFGILHMVIRIRSDHMNVNQDRFERQALRITGTAFYLLAAGLVVVAAINLIQGHRPETTFWGIVIAVISIMTMWLLIHFKLQVGKALGSEAIIADAHCTRACMYLSFLLLAASLGYELTGIGSLDSIGSAGIAWLAWREGREAFQKAAGKMTCSCQGNCSS
jgi:divalent metal cation (Fe/Co/Zn/Cd) transporter